MITGYMIDNRKRPGHSAGHSTLWTRNLHGTAKYCSTGAGPPPFAPRHSTLTQHVT
jgi:hypothetical protein